MNKLKCTLVLAFVTLAAGCDSASDPGDPNVGKTTLGLKAGSACEIAYSAKGYKDPCAGAHVGYCVVPQIANDLSFGEIYVDTPEGTPFMGVCQADCHVQTKPAGSGTETDFEVPIDSSCGDGTCHLFLVTDPQSTLEYNVMPSCDVYQAPIYECFEQSSGHYFQIGDECSDGSRCTLTAQPGGIQFPTCGGN
ncbi:MAG TPA: hypothetical protein VH374_15335 [Polyangia bacterium]|nr:hypothetical protein [Polyangia bacterium]